MMITTDVKPRTGLNTSTGQRNQPRMAGGMPVKQVNSFELPAGTLQERIDALMKKAKEQDEYNKVTEANKNRFLIGETPEASVGGSVAVLDGVADRTRKSFGQLGSDANQLSAQKGQIENNLARDAKASGLGQYNGTIGGVMQPTEYGQGRYNSAFEQGQALNAAARDQAAAASLEAQRNNNRISAKTAADAASAADNAYSQRYAAAQAADAQKFASTMQMFGNITQPGAYKYWGG